MADPGGPPQQVASRFAEDIVDPRALRAAVSGFSAAITATDVAGSLFEHARALFGASGGGLAWRTATDVLEIIHAHGASPDPSATVGAFPVSGALPACEAVRSGAPVLLSTPEEIASRCAELEALCRARGVRAWITVPLRTGGRTVGALGLTFTRPSPLDAAALALLLALADEGAAALARARRYEEERSLREAAERYSDALAARALEVARVEEALRRQVAVAEKDAALLVEARRAAEEAAAAATRSAAELDAVLAAIPAGIAVFDREGRVLRANAAARCIVGSSEAGREGSAGGRFPCPGLLGADGRPLAPDASPLARALHGETVAGETYARTPATSGERTTWVTMSAAPVLDPAGDRAGVVAAMFDVTREHELLEMREDLLRMISHDLRTPLQAVLTHAHLIRRAPELPRGVADRADAIVRTSERMAGMLQDLTEMVLLESGHLTLSPVPLDVPAFLREVLERLSAPLPPDRIRLRATGPIPPVHADPARLERVVVNLLSNALKYSPPEAPVDVSVHAAPRGGAEIEVADRGVGIPPENVPRIFGRFYRVSGGGRQPEGLGLGLYIARLLVEAHGGWIAVDTAPGRGSRFTVRLPPAPAPRA